jgi:RecA-family ATPase
VLIMSAEDGLADTIRPRPDAASGDPSRVHVLTESADVLTLVTLGDHQQIADRIEHVRARLLINDVTAYLPAGTDAQRDQAVRGVLAPLAKIAERTGCTILLLRHLTKASSALRAQRSRSGRSTTGVES